MLAAKSRRAPDWARTAAPAPDNTDGMDINRFTQYFYSGLKFSDIKPISNIISEIQAAGPGARGIVFGYPNGYATGDLAHFFNVVNQGGQVRFLCGQAGGSLDLSKFEAFRLMRTF